MVGVVDSLIKQGERLNRQFVTDVRQVTGRRVVVTNLKVRPQTTVYKEITYPSDLWILSSDTHVHPQSYANGNFNLSDGTEGTTTTAYVRNLNNTFMEFFGHSNFIHSSSTGSITNNTFVLNNTEILVSEIIDKNNDNIVSAYLEVVSSNNTGLTLEVSFDNGVSWGSITNKTTKVNSSLANSELRYRVTNSSGSDITINKIIIRGNR